VVDFGALDGSASFEFHFTAIKAGASTAIAGNNAFAIKLDQWNEQGLFGTTQFGVADNLFEGSNVESVFDVPVHVVITSDADAGESLLYIDGALAGDWAGNIALSGDTKVMGARLEQETDHMGEGSVMHAWATYSGILTAAEISSKFEALPDVSTGGGGDGGGGGTAGAVMSLAGVPDTGSGLDGRYWQAGVKSIDNLQDKGGEKDIGLSIINGTHPTGVFKATGLTYSGGNDLTPVREWLQGDGDSYVGGDGNMDDGVLSFTGYIRIDNPGEMDIRSESDDGSVIWIAGTKVVDNDGGHGAPGPTPDGSYNFETAGLYPVEIAWYNGDWTNDAGDHGGANLNVLADGNPIPGEILYSAADVSATAIAASSLTEETGDAGLVGAYWTTEPKGMEFGEDGQGPIFQVTPGDDHGLALMETDPQGSFISTGVSYTGNDLTPILEWLADDSGSFVGTEGNLDDGMVQLKGFINIAESGFHDFRSASDDGSVVWIGNQKVVDNDGGHGAPGPNPDGTAFFAVPGLYPIEVAWFNGDWTNDAGDHGGANIDLTMNGDSLADIIFQPVGGIPSGGGVEATFHAIDQAYVTTEDSDLWALSNLIQGPGVGFNASAPYEKIIGGADGNWVTDAPGGYPADYIEVAGAPVIDLDLGADVALGEISIWGYDDGNANGVSEVSLRFATDAEGFAGYGQSITYNPTFTLTQGIATERQSSLFSETVTARYVEVTVVDNFYLAPGDGSEGGKAGGDRVGLGEIALQSNVSDTAGGGGAAISSVTLSDGAIVIEYTGTLKTSSTVNGDYSDVAGASSPYSVAADQEQSFFMAD
jgi:hypothetical protein